MEAMENMGSADTFLRTGQTMLLWGGPLLAFCVLLLAAVHLAERRRATLPVDPRARIGNTAAAVAGLAAGLLVWALWFSWGFPGGSGTVLSVGATVTSYFALVWLGVRTRWPWTGPFVVALGGLTGFSTAFGLADGSSDVTGLWLIGYVLVTAGGAVVLALISAGIVVVRSSDWRD